MLLTKASQFSERLFCDFLERIVTTRSKYITDSSDKVFLNKEAYNALGMISENFPTIGEITGSEADITKSS